VEALVSTDAVSRDYHGFGSTAADNVSDSVSDCASEISDDVASVIEMPITSGDDGDFGDGARSDEDGNNGRDEETESGISPDCDFTDKCSFPPLQQTDGIGYFRPFMSVFSEPGRGRSPTPTPDDIVSPATVPVAATNSESWNGSSAVEPVVGRRRVSVNIREQRGDGSFHRDFSQTAPWRVSGVHQRSGQSLLFAAAVGTSFSDPNIVSSSAAADQTSKSSKLIVNSRLSTRRVPASDICVPSEGGKGELETSSPSEQESNVIRIPISFGSTSISSPAAAAAAVTPRIAATVPIVSVTDRSSTNSDARSSSLSKSEPVTATSVQISNPRCYIPQKPPPLPMPGSAGSEPRASLRSVRSTTTANSETAETEQPSQSKQYHPATTRRWNDDANDRPTRQKDDAKINEYINEVADLPKRPVREMVAELNNRLERCERSAAEVADGGSPLDSPYGSRYDLREAEAARGRQRSSSGSDSEREIIIDTPPASAMSRFSDEEQTVSRSRHGLLSALYELLFVICGIMATILKFRLPVTLDCFRNSTI